MNKQNEANSNQDVHQVAVRHEEVNTGLRVLNLLDEKQLASAEVFLKKLIATEKGGIKSVNEGLAVLMRAQDLKLPFSTCIEHIHVINGKTGIDIHVIKSLLSRAGVDWVCTKDYTPLYQYTDGNTIYNETQLPDYVVKCRTAAEAEKLSDGEKVGVYPLKWYADLKGNVYNEFQVSDKCTRCINKVQAMKVVKEGGFPVIRVPAQPIDYVTEYEFTRYRMINGKERVSHAKSHFSLSEAQTAGFFEKDTYKKYARIMIAARAFTYGARDIASDVLFGCMETTELKLVEDVGLTSSDFENAQVIDEIASE